MTQMEREVYVPTEAAELRKIADTFGEMPLFLTAHEMSLRDGLAYYGRLSQEARDVLRESVNLDTEKLTDANAAVDAIESVITSFRMKVSGECPSTFADRSLLLTRRATSQDANQLRQELMDYARYFSMDPQTSMEDLAAFYQSVLQSSGYDLTRTGFHDGVPVIAQVVTTIRHVYFPGYGLPMVQSKNESRE